MRRSKIRLARRSFLRGMAGGAAVAFALPALDIMLDDHGTALADGTELPRRFGLWFFGNGVRREFWIPDGEGKLWTPRAELQPFADADLLAYLNVISGLEIKTPKHAHHSGMTGITTGAPMQVLGNVRDTIASTVSQPTIDVVAANYLKGKTPFQSLELGVCNFHGTDEGTTFQYLSMNGPNDPNPSERSPVKIFERLFGTSPADPKFARETQARKSALDVVQKQIRALQGSVGKNDKQRLEQHFDSIRAIETRLQLQGTTACAAPGMPVDPTEVSGKEPIAEKNKLVSDLLGVALACDLSRVFSVLFETCGGGTYFWQTNADDGMHSMCHAGANDLVHDAVVFTMSQCAYFLGVLKATPEGAGNLLDNSSILITTEHSEGDTHSQDEFPILTAGRGGGKLKSGIHYRSTTKENTSKALLSVLRGAGLPLAELGHEAGKVSEGITAIEG